MRGPQRCEVLKDARSSKMRGPIMLKQLVALLHLSLSDLVTSGGFATTFRSTADIRTVLSERWM